MQTARRRLREVFVYKQKGRPPLDSHQVKTDFVGDLNVREGSRKRIVGKSAKGMASTLILNLDGKEGICLHVNAKSFEALVREGATIPLMDEIVPLENPELQTVVRILRGEGLGGVEVDES